MVVKKGSTHQRADHLSRMVHGELPKGVDDNLLEAYLFSIEMVPKWSEKLVPLMTFGRLDIPLPLREKQAMIHQASALSLQEGRLYHKGQDGVLRLCIEPSEQTHYI